MKITKNINGVEITNEFVSMSQLKLGHHYLDGISVEVEEELLHINNCSYVPLSDVTVEGIKRSVCRHMKENMEHSNMNMHMSEIFGTRRQSTVWCGGCFEDNR